MPEVSYTPRVRGVCEWDLPLVTKAVCTLVGVWVVPESSKSDGTDIGNSLCLPFNFVVHQKLF